ncbi:MAG: hypothetical protein HYS05_09150 [Acidobacteria bacterium]|nr:hypothetical protein [Acidobacteriota bacterium]
MRQVLAVVLTLLVCGVDSALAQQPAAPAAGAIRPRLPAVVRKTDVIYGRIQGSALLTELAYTETERLKPAIVYVFGGRWRAGVRARLWTRAHGTDRRGATGSASLHRPT